MTYHPLICHMLDVASVAEAMWDKVLSAWGRRRIAATLDMSEHGARSWIAFLAGAHDLGKASPGFQLLSHEAHDRLCAAGMPTPPLASWIPHGAVTALTLPKTLVTKFGVAATTASRLGVLVGGHHGRFPTAYELNNLSTVSQGAGRWEVVRTELAIELGRLLGLEESCPPTQIDNPMGMWLAGLVSVADWIGSDEEYFAYAVEEGRAFTSSDTIPYSRHAKKTALLALDRLGWLGWSPHSQQVSFKAMFGFGPNAMQREVVSLGADLNDEPGLVIIEAAMGEGKTEAAMWLADRFTSVLGQSGCYFALPTQATSNQMFSRFRSFLKHRYSHDVVNLQLLHGGSSLSSEFQELQQNGDKLFTIGRIYGDEPTDIWGPEVIAAEWFTYRKRGVLAPFGVGTIDQALLSILQTRHMFVRLFGLAHKTVVIDEVHAYDTYMSSLLEQLIRWLASLDTSVVLLSATLPDCTRRRLTRAYESGLPAQHAVNVPAATYPRVTSYTASGGCVARTIPHSSVEQKRVALEWVEASLPLPRSRKFAIGECLHKLLGNGGCAAVICNTVNRAQDVYTALKPFFPDLGEDGYPELDLLHARYTVRERDKREKRVLARFGKGGSRPNDGSTVETVRRPFRAVLVATQVVEQSLDIDFDLMITDLAPADLVLQRAGRLHRHNRPGRPTSVATPRILITKPAMNGEVPTFDRGTEHVYDRHVLSRSWLALKNRTSLSVPVDVEELVESVYDERPCPHRLSQPLRGDWFTSQKQFDEKIARNKWEADNRDLKPPDYDGHPWELTGEPREEDQPDFHHEHQALTRLTDPSVSLVLLRGSEDKPVLHDRGQQIVDLTKKPSVHLAKALLAQSVSLTDRRVVHSLLSQATPSGWQRSPLLRNHRHIILNDEGEASCGSHVLRLDEELGMTIDGPKHVEVG